MHSLEETYDHLQVAADLPTYNPEEEDSMSKGICEGLLGHRNIMICRVTEEEQKPIEQGKGLISFMTCVLLYFLSRSGVKYILRTDVMYRRCDNGRTSPREERAILLLQDAERCEVRERGQWLADGVGSYTLCQYLTL